MEPLRRLFYLNIATIPDFYPLPNILDFTSLISGSTVFSKLDLHKGFYQVPMNEDDIQKTDHVVWYVQVSPPSLRTQEHWEHLLEDNGSDPRQPSILFCLCQRHFDL